MGYALFVSLVLPVLISSAREDDLSTTTPSQSLAISRPTELVHI